MFLVNYLPEGIDKDYLQRFIKTIYKKLSIGII